MCPLFRGSTVHKEEDNLSIVDKMATWHVLSSDGSSDGIDNVDLGGLYNGTVCAWPYNYKLTQYYSHMHLFGNMISPLPDTILQVLAITTEKLSYSYAY